MASRVRRDARLTFEALSIEGGLLSPEWLARVAQLSAGQQSEGDYRVPKGLSLRDEIGRYWRIAHAYWNEFAAGLEHRATGPEDVHRRRALTERFIGSLLRDVFGFASLEAITSTVIDGRHYPISMAALNGRVPVVVTAAGEGVESASAAFGDGGRRRSPFGLAQEYLNAAAGATWGIVTDGHILRIVRDNASLTRPAWIQADLLRMFSEERYADFAALWLLAHESRFVAVGRSSDGPEGASLLDTWRSAGQNEGTRAREDLREGFRDALLSLGQGFLSHPDNSSLRAALHGGALTRAAYFQQLLRLVYRLIFLLTVEERGLLHPPETPDETRRLYTAGYALARLRDRSLKRTGHDRFSDLWAATTIVFRGLANGEPRLGLAALAGLFAPNQCPDLDRAGLENRALLSAVYRLAWLKQEAGVVRVNWRDMGPEELGSVYESLLELQPQITQEGRIFTFARAGQGNARKTTGSYYTPDSLVQVLLESALEPVVADAIAKNSETTAEALLSLSIVDPACGSGHFLLAAARRLAACLARVQAGGTPSTAEYRRAVRQVISRCIYGVDLNPMAVELCKVSLWMEAVEPGLPLSFLDSHIQQGNALLGTTPQLMAKGIPDSAWEPIEGDDKKVASALKKRNKAEAAGQRALDFGSSLSGDSEAQLVARAVAELDAASDENPAALAKKESQWEDILGSTEYRHQKFLADAWCAAFVWPKHAGELSDAAPTARVWRELQDRQGQPRVLTTQTVNMLAEQYRFFHWHLQFPQAFAKGGFDVVLGNPPWERIKLLEEEFFAERDSAIARASNTSQRRRLVNELQTVNPSLYEAYLHARRHAEGTSFFVQKAGRFPLTGCGDINTYALFSESNRALVGPGGRAGFIVQSDIATSETYKDFFASLLEKRQLISLFDFVNTEGLFPGVHRTHPHFCLATLGPPNSSDRADLAFWNTNVGHLREPDRHFSLSFAELAAINPETRNCAVFRSRRDADITTLVHRRVPTLGSQRGDGAWSAEIFQKMIDATIHADVISFSEDPPATDWYPVYEGRMVHLFDHRYATYEGVSAADREEGNPRIIKESEHQDPTCVSKAAFWVSPDTFRQRISSRTFSHRWFVSVRYVSNTTNERTVICCIRPYVPSNNKLVSVLLAVSARLQAAFVANMASLPLDYLTRQKMGGTTLAGYIVRQLPMVPAEVYATKAAWTDTALEGWFLPRILELTYTAWDLETFAEDVGYHGPPFRWDAERRFLLRCELDAAFFHLYGFSRDDTDYVTDTFPIVRKNDEKAYGAYRTKNVILEVYDAMAEAARSGHAYETRLTPGPADLLVAHSPRSTVPAVPQMPSIRPSLPPIQDGAILIWAILHAGGGAIRRSDLARAFALRSRPELLTRLAPVAVKAVATEWAKSMKAATMTGTLAAVLSDLAGRSGVDITIDAEGRSMVKLNANAPALDEIEDWYRFEASLVVHVLKSLPATNVAAVDAAVGGDDRALLVS
jgi:hypothetical protein